jgi:hypothetical protein
MDPTRQAMIEEIDEAFNNLYGLLTSATHRAELGDMSTIARGVDASRTAFQSVMLHREAYGTSRN